MSSFPLFSKTPVGCPVFTPQPTVPPRKISAEALLATSLPNVVPASRLEVRAAPELVSSGVRELDALTGGLPRGCLTEVCGAASSGRTSLLLALLAAATRRQEACALVDGNDSFDPASAASAGVNFERLLWVRCGVERVAAERHKNSAHGVSRGFGIEGDLAPKGRKQEHEIEQVLRVTDLLLQSGGFGLVAIDFGDVPFKIARRIPLTSWFRFQRAVEHTPTVLFVITQAPCAQSCASLLLKMKASEKKLSAFSRQLSADLEKSRASAPEVPSHTELLEGFHVHSEVLRSRLPRKPARSVTAAFVTEATRFA
jgi:hypothetical protein